MKYRVFASEQEAVDAEKAISQIMGLAKVGINAKTGLPDLNAAKTERWAIPQQIQDGSWVFPSPDSEGVEAQEDWWPKPKDIF